MKKIYFYVVITLCVTAYSFGQINNHWRLGASDIDFTTSSPTASNPPTNNTNYGSASISDANGTLLFYTDGLKIYTNQNQVMSIASNVVDVHSLTNSARNTMQPAIIVPNLANNKQYFVFLSTNDPNLGNFSSTSIYVLTVDFSNPNYSDGIIIAYSSIGDRYCLFAPLTVVKNSTNDGYFIITSGVKDTPSGQEYNGNIEFRSYKLTSAGLDLNNPTKTPIISTDIGYSNFIAGGSIGFNNYFSKGIIKFTPDNATLGILVKTDYGNTDPYNCPSSYSQFSTCTFDNTTGLFSTFVQQQFGSNNLPSDIGTIIDFEFSSNSNNVYFISNLPSTPNSVFNRIYVKNLSNYLSLRQLTSPTDSSPDGFQNITRDKNGNILISSNHYYSGYIQRIENQDNNTLSYINLNYINLYGNDFNNNYNINYNGFYLPQLIPELPTCTPSLIITSNVTTGIDKKQASVSIQASNTISSGAGIIYHAPTVVIKPGFTALVGSTAHIYPIGCTNTYTAKFRSPTKTISNIETKTAAEFMTLFPNPNNGVFKISLNEITNGTITITNFNGRTVYQSDFKNQSEFDMNLQDQSKGVYIVKVVSENKTEVKKIIIQ